MIKAFLAVSAFLSIAQAQAEQGGADADHGEHGDHDHEHGSPAIFYGYLLILVFAVIACVTALVTQTGLTHKNGIYNKFTRWSLYTPTLRYTANHRSYITLPSTAHMIGILALCAFPTMLVLTGPESPSMVLSRTSSDIHDSMERNAFDRTGVMAFILTPLVVILGLKMPPFAIFAWKFFTNLHFDKAVLFHFVSGVGVWAFSFAHTVLWIKHTWPERDETGVWNEIWSSRTNSSGFMALLFLSLILVLSIPPIRNKFYALFHIVHIVLVFAFLVAAGIHYKPLAPFIWTPLAFWLAERVWRGLRVLWLNAGAGRFAGEMKKGKGNAGPGSGTGAGVHWSTVMRPAQTIRSLVSPQMDKPANLTLLGWEELEKSREAVADESSTRSNTNSQSQSKTTVNKSNDSVEKYLSPIAVVNKEKDGAKKDTSTPSLVPPPSSLSFPIRRSHPTGFTHAQLLPGKSVRLTLCLSSPLHWQPGQHASIIIPEISRFGAHPFTIANVSEDDPYKVVVIVRAKSGWTRKLWEKVRLMRQPKFITSEQQQRSDGNGNGNGTEHRNDAHSYLPCAAPPVYIRALIDGPFGSAGRVRWSNYSSILLVCGGSGISFGVSILQHVTNVISLGAGPLRRVRLVWLVKEFAHVQWVASALRRCATLLPQDAFQLEIFVTSQPTIDAPNTISSFFPSPDSPFPPTPAAPYAGDAGGSPYSPPRSPVQRFYTPATNLGEDSGDAGDLGRSHSDLSMQTAAASITPTLQVPPVAVNATHSASRIQPSFRSARSSPQIDKNLPPVREREQKQKQQQQQQQQQYQDHVAESDFTTAASNQFAEEDIDDINKRSSINDFVDFDGEDNEPAPAVERELSTLISAEGDIARARSNMGHSVHMHPTQTTLTHPDKPTHAPNITFAETPKVHTIDQSNSDPQASHTPHTSHTSQLKMPDPDNIVLDAIEEGDLFSIAEFARSGRPKLDTIFSQESELVDDNALLVATCGPDALNLTMKNLVSKSKTKTVAFEESFSW
ncbi:hypothetical protein E3P77_02046 [Wallemia ichthyophaga]|uniref:ferric-chelate reductase (NADPH) n=1 Tax=Wallemia ichthyophaga TaxID=245174 RepID=A0A4T0HBH2_WALIC|nr:hypothetical protein E3P90_02306 [Wallemia ichthyophaga]TIB13107.1 hypothetical protein E3P93_02066 [Wallemia ichthyophaga]TIB22277.1 hypothetical protein E3P89_02171 [Wallemia ichthyophaga]TIB24020.1 hypothetical protein E3P88_02262 [Wallemia ichthyophaga]TIB66764.1 hypothetical protein E3P77_02046 [Wallemia ichthyophaga]